MERDDDNHYHQEHMLLQRLDRLEEAVFHLTKLVETRLVPECERMGNHINFIECIYEKLRRPLSILRSNSFGTNDDGLLPSMIANGPSIEEVD